MSKSHAIDADIYSTGDAFCDAHPKLAGMGERQASYLSSPDGANMQHAEAIAMKADDFNILNEGRKYSQPYSFFIGNTGLTSAFDTDNPIEISGSSGASEASGTTSPWSVTPGSGVSGVDGSGFNVNGSYGGGTAGGVSGSGTLTAPDSKDKQAIFNARLSLIEKYCDKYGKSVDIDKIKSEYGSNLEEGIKHCDDILNNQFDQTKLKRLVQKEYNDYNKGRLDAGKEVSDQWVDAIIGGGLPAPETGGGVSKENVLDVVGTFMTNKEVKRGKVSLDNVMEQPEVTSKLIDALKEKADEVLQYDNLDAGVKNSILSQIAVLRDNYDKYTDSIEDDDKHNDLGFNQVRKQLATGYENLFATLRTEESKRNDKAAPQYYGLPENSSIKLTSQSDRANEEISSYRGRTKLNTTF